MIAWLLVLNFAHANSGNCVKSITEFRKSAKLTRILGKDYDPYFKWEGTAGVQILPDGNGSMYVKVPALGKVFGYKDSPMPLEICYENGKAFARRYEKRIEFNDPKGNSMTMEDDGHKATFRRVLR